MPHRKKTTVNLNDLECYPALIEELRNNPDFSDKELTTLKLTVLDSCKATIKEVDKAIIHFLVFRTFLQHLRNYLIIKYTFVILGVAKYS